MKKIMMIVTAAMGLLLLACGGQDSGTVEPRAVFNIDRLYLDEVETSLDGTPFEGAQLTFVGEEQGGNVIISIGGAQAQASINPSREHPSFESGYWHHHLYAGNTAAGSPRINFMELFPDLGIDDLEDPGTPDQSSYQRGNLHYVVETGEFRLRLTIGGVIHDLLFAEV